HVVDSDLPLMRKIHAFLHLFNSSVFVALFLAGLLSLPMMFIKDASPSIHFLFSLGGIFLLGFLSVALFCWTAAQRFYADAGRKFIILFPTILVRSMGLSLHDTVAVVEGWLGVKSPFKRTPKFNLVKQRDPWTNNAYL